MPVEDEAARGATVVITSQHRRESTMGNTVKVLVAGVEYPLTLSTAEVAKLFNCSAELLQRQVATGQLPCEPLRLGHRLRWPTLKVASAVGLSAELIEVGGGDDRTPTPASYEGPTGSKAVA